jgi:hypothetical protein
VPTLPPSTRARARAREAIGNQTHDLHDLAAVSVDGQHHAVEIAVEYLDDGIRRQHVRHEGEVAQIDEHQRRRDGPHIAAADLALQDEFSRLTPNISPQHVGGEPPQALDAQAGGDCIAVATDVTQES